MLLWLTSGDGKAAVIFLFNINLHFKTKVLSGLNIYMYRRTWEISCFIWDLKGLLFSKAFHVQKKPRSPNSSLGLSSKTLLVSPESRFPPAAAEKKSQNIFYFLAFTIRFFFLFLLVLLCIVTSIYNSLYLTPLRFFFFFFLPLTSAMLIFVFSL